MLLLTALALCACTRPLPAIHDTATPDTASPPDMTPVVTQGADMGTAIHLEWQAQPDISVDFEYRSEDGEGQALTLLPTTAGPQDRVFSGLIAATRYTWSFSAQGQQGQTGSFTTGAPPPELPVLHVSGTSGAPGFIVSSLLRVPSTAVVIDTQGRYRWWYQVDEHMVTRALLSQDGQQIIVGEHDMLKDSPDVADDNVIRRVSLDGSRVDAIPAPGLHHDLTELPDGTLAYIAYDRREIDGQTIEGDQIIEITPDGTATPIWSSFDDLSPEGIDRPTGAWTKANALDYDVEEDSYLLGLRNLNAIACVDRATGSLRWVWGPEGDFAMTGGGRYTIGQHQFQKIGARLLVFDNGDQSELVSRVKEYSLDEDAHATEQTWSYQGQQDAYVYALGDVDLLPNDNLLVDWSTSGLMEEVTTAGESVWTLEVDMGAGFGYTTHYNDFGG